MKLFYIPILILFLFSCKKNKQVESPTAYRITKNISYNNISVDVIIDKPAINNLDVLLVFHGTVQSDSEIITAANTTLDEFKGILDRKNMMIVSVAHPQENILFGDNITQAEAALLWVKSKSRIRNYCRKSFFSRTLSGRLFSYSFKYYVSNKWSNC
jgi:hypothetical protein